MVLLRLAHDDVDPMRLEIITWNVLEQRQAARSPKPRRFTVLLAAIFHAAGTRMMDG